MFLIASINFLVFNISNVWDAQMEHTMSYYENIYSSEQNERMRTYMGYVKQFNTIIVLFIVPFIAIAASRMLPKPRYTLAELSIFGCYAMGLSILTALPLFIIYVAFPSTVAYTIFVSTGSNCLIIAWFIRDMYKQSWFNSILLGFSIYIGGFILMILTIFILFIVLILLYILIRKVFSS